MSGETPYLVNMLVVLGYAVAVAALWRAATLDECRKEARVALLSLGTVGFLFATGRYLFAHGITQDWLFVAGHLAFAGHCLFTVHVSKGTRNSYRDLEAEHEALKKRLTDIESATSEIEHGA